MLFENKDGGKIMLSDLIQAFSLSGTIQGYQAWKKETKAKDKSRTNYLKIQKAKLSKLGFKALPKSQQRFILEEAIANLLGKKMDQQKKNEYINKEDQSKTDNAVKRFWSISL